MPEWFTHVLFAWILFELVAIKFRLEKKWLALFLLGAVLPDIEKLFIYLLGDTAIAASPQLQFLMFHGIAHTMAILLVGVFLASLWRKQFMQAFAFIAIGVFSHMFLDTFTSSRGIMWLWPLSWERFGFQLFWSDWVALPFIMLFWLGLIKFLKGDFNFISLKNKGSK